MKERKGTKGKHSDKRSKLEDRKSEARDNGVYKKNIEVNVEIKRANKIEVRWSKEIIIAEINKWEEKNNVMKTKNKLK